jgi:hypothetical protein
LRDRALAVVGLVAGLVIDRLRQAIERARGIVGAARLRERVERWGSGVSGGGCGRVEIGDVEVEPSLSCPAHADTIATAIRPSATRVARNIPPRFTPSWVQVQG